MWNKELVAQEAMLREFDSNHYQAEQLWATASDGTQVPISLVYRKDLRRDGQNPLLLTGYGMYGSSQEARFPSDDLSLLDRGFICATAHVRGGGELPNWWEEGKHLKKKNSFTDFIACARYLVEEGFTASDILFASGSSGGGLLMGGVVNMAPELFKGVIAEVPYVDIISAIRERGQADQELGDLSLEAKEYRHLLVTAGYHDSQVEYWQPAKWVAKLRAKKTDQNLLLLKITMEAGHAGVSGRYVRLRETAEQYAFLLHLAGINK